MNLPGWWRAIALLMLALAATPAFAIDESDLLPVDEAFALNAVAVERGRIEITWKIADGYYLYRHRTDVQTVEGAFQPGPLQLPRGKPYTDQFFGKVETYRTRLTAVLPGAPDSGAGQVRLRVKYQGCADVGVCYPPQVRMLTVTLPADADAAPGGTSPLPGNDASIPGSPLLGRPNKPLFGTASAIGGNPLPLPPEQAFGFEAIAADGNTLLLRFTPARGYYLYRDRTSLKLTADGLRAGPGRATVALGSPQWPKGLAHRDEYFGNMIVYSDQIEVPLPLRRARADAQEVTLTAIFQGCQNNGICYPPMTRKVLVALPAGTITAAQAAPTVDTTSAEPASGSGGAALAEDGRLAAALAGNNRWWTLLGFLGAGLLLAFTPCVYPMIPILVGLLAGQGTRLGTRRALWLSLVYVLANALVFTAAGIVAGLVGANLQAAFQTPWVLVAFALMFVALALSSFGLFELRVPMALRARLGAISDRQRGGSMLGVAAMGALSALIVGPCVAPPLAAAVLYIGQTHDPVFGGTALFLMAMGMGLPLLAFGAAAGRGMPTSGPWMTTMQRIFGFVFLALAVWMLSRVLPAPITLALYGLLALAMAAWLFSLVKSAAGSRARWFAQFAALVLAVIGAAELLGALGNGRDPLQPLAGMSGKSESRELPFRIIKSTADFDRELATAQATGKPLLLDFYADWCAACKEMAQYTFARPEVQAALAGVVLLKADVTANDDLDQALMRRMGVVGPPAALFFVDGRERRESRLIGFEKAEPFVARVQRATRQ